MWHMAAWGAKPTWWVCPSGEAQRCAADCQRTASKRSRCCVAVHAPRKQGAGSSRGASRGALQLRWVHRASLLLLCTEGVCYQRGVTDGLRLPFNIRVGTSDLTRPCTKGLRSTTLKERSTLTRHAGTSHPDTLLHHKIESLGETGDPERSKPVRQSRLAILI